MLAVVWPGFWVLSVPIIVVETLVGRKILDGRWNLAIKTSVIANLVSIVLGIPLSWLLLLFPGFLLLVPAYIAWLPPFGLTESLVLADAAVLCVVFFFASYFIEARVARWVLPILLRERAKKWSWRVNLASYIPIVVLLSIAAVWFGFFPTPPAFPE